MSHTESHHKLWGGRFSEPLDALVERFSASVSVDQRLALVDLAGSRAHARMLAAIGALTEGERDRLIAGLDAIEDQVRAGAFIWRADLEDVHMNIEAALTEALGDLGKRLHTARSRNDQVATDLRLYLREQIDRAIAALEAFARGLIERADLEAATVMPGFTHLQAAQPVTLGHHLLAWLEMLERDRERLVDCRRRVNVMPLGAAALAGTSFPVDREMTARLLGFDRPARNSLDAVSDRDFAIEFCSAAALTMVHLSRMAEELILWASPAFGFVTLPDRLCTGSSIMPQKKNPDVPELVRGKSARVIGQLMTLLTLMKGQPLAYNRDNQEDKLPVFDSADTLVDSLTVLASLVPQMTVHREVMATRAGEGFSTATDLADYLVRRGMAFRDAHACVGQLVQAASEAGLGLSELPLERMQSASALIEEDVYAVLTVAGSVAARDHVGGTAPAQVRVQAQAARVRWAQASPEASG